MIIYKCIGSKNHFIPCHIVNNNLDLSNAMVLPDAVAEKKKKSLRYRKQTFNNRYHL